MRCATAMEIARLGKSDAASPTHSLELFANDLAPKVDAFEQETRKMNLRINNEIQMQKTPPKAT